MNNKKKIDIYVDIDFRELIPFFFEDTQNDIKSIRLSLSKNNYEDIARIGHSLKGTGGSYGFHFLTDAGAALEREEKNKNKDAIQEWLYMITHYLDKVNVLFK